MRRNERRQRDVGEPSGQRAMHVDAMPQLRLRTITLSVAIALSAYPDVNVFAQELPSNPQVVGGVATITQSGNQQTINQSTNRAIINWGSFSIGTNNSVRFIQPGSSSVILNRVIGNDPSNILGSMTANGKVFLVNPNGIFFGPASSVDTGGLVATTMSIRDNDFMSGYFNFERAGTGSVENAGLITIRDGGYALLAADQVRNTETGVISAPGGSVALTSADRVTIETNQDGMVGFSVSGDSLREVAQVDNAGLITADGGSIMLSARGAQELTGMVVNNSGVIRAQTVEEQDGVIILSGSSGTTQSNGVLDASGMRGGNIQVTNQHGVAAVAGNIMATGSEDTGGRIVVAGRQTGLFAGTDIDASGGRGGVVRIGGEYRGEAVEGITSQQTYVAASAGIKADGTAGDGGSIVVWADDVTRYDGHISARGAGAGKGGDAEVSGKRSLAFNGTADLGSVSGEVGTLLLDPDEIEIVNGNAGDGDFDGEFGAPPANQIGFAVADVGSSTISKGTLEAAAENANVHLQATNDIRVNVAELNMRQTGDGSFKLETANGDIRFMDANNRITTQGGSIELDAGGSIIGGRLASNGGDITLKSGESITAGNIASSGGNVRLDSGSTLTTASINAGTGTVSLSSVGDLTTEGQITAGPRVAIHSSNGAINIKQSISATGGAAGVGVESASVEISAKGNISQTAGTIKAEDTAPAQFNTENEPHYAQVEISSSNGSVSLTNVAAESTGGRAQINVMAKSHITATGLVESKAAAQPGISMSSSDGDITTTDATIKVTQTAEKSITENGKTTLVNPYKVVQDVGGISIEGGKLNLGRMESVSTAASGTALFGIATASRKNTTFNNLVKTNADAGISVSIKEGDADTMASTEGNGKLEAKALALTAGRDQGIFRLRTDISSLTVLGGRGVDIDNTAHGAGVLTISALGRISDKTTTTTEQGTLETEETDNPVGGVRIKSQNINLLSLDNRSTNSYRYDGTKTNGFLQNPQQDLVLIADNIEFLPGTIQTKADTYVQLRPTDNRNIQIAFAQQAIPNTTVYSGGFAGLLNQFHPDSSVLIGGSDYAGNIYIGSSSNIAEQISLGNMTLFFETTGRVYNNYASNPDAPSLWDDGTFQSPPYSPVPAFLCTVGQACLSKLTTSKIYIKDSLKQGNPDDNRFRNVVIQGNGSGEGGTTPTTYAGGGNSGGGSGGGGSSGGGGGGGGSNDNDSGPGGVNAPSDNPGGGGNAEATPQENGTTQVTNNPGQNNGNPGGNPGNNTDPATPGDTSGGVPQNGGIDPGGDALAGGGSFSGEDGGAGSDGGTLGGNQNAGEQAGGGTYSDGSTPGSNNPGGGNGTQVAGDQDNTNSNNTNTADTGTTGGSGGGGNVSDGSGTPSDNTQVASDNGGNQGGFTGGGSGTGAGDTTGGEAGDGSGGGMFSDGSSTTSGTQLADGGSQGAGQDQSNTGGSGSGDGYGSSSGDAADATTFAGGASSSNGAMADGDTGGFVGGASSSVASSEGAAGGTGGATFSDGTDSNTAGGTMLADAGGNTGDTGSGQSPSDGATEFTGGASGTTAYAGDGGSQAEVAGSQSSDESVANAEESVFEGGASGGGSGDATLLAENTQEHEYPECGDEDDSVKQISRAGQPYADIVQMKATGVRLRGDNGSLNQQRAPCARATAHN